MNKIVKYGNKDGRVSPLANNWELYKELKNISITRGVEFGLMVGISYRESNIGVNFAPRQQCGDSNNRGGMKWNRDWHGDLSVKYNIQYSQDGLDNLKGCYLYAFDNVQDFWRGFANFLYYGYTSKGCNTPECISKYYVKNDGVVKSGWSNSVNLFRNN